MTAWKRLKSFCLKYLTNNAKMMQIMPFYKFFSTLMDQDCLTLHFTYDFMDEILYHNIPVDLFNDYRTRACHVHKWYLV